MNIFAQSLLWISALAGLAACSGRRGDWAFPNATPSMDTQNADNGTRAGGPWCAGQLPPAGSRVSDFQCLDFDRENWANWVTTREGGGVETSTELAVSEPYALRASVDTDSDAAAQLSWSSAPGAAVKAAAISAKINPGRLVVDEQTPWVGYVELLCLSTGGAKTCLSFARESSTGFSNDYTGYYLSFLHAAPSGLVRNDCAIPQSISEGEWSDVQLRASISSAAVEFLVNEEPAADCTGLFDEAATATATVGLKKSTNERRQDASTWEAFFDNITVAVER